MRDQRIEGLERLTHIRDAIQKIELFIHDIKRKTFLDDSLVSSAVLFQFSVIGEAVNHIGIDVLEKYDYPWYKIRAFRNLISHVYFQIKLESVWDIIINDLPELKELVDRILKQEF